MSLPSAHLLVNNKIIKYYLIILYLAFDFIIALVACTQDSHFSFILVSGLKRRPQINLNFESEFDTKLKQFYFTNSTGRHVAKYNSRCSSYYDLS